VLQTIGERMVLEGQPGGRRVSAHAFIPLDPKPDREGPEVRVPLRRGVTLKGRAIGPDDRPIPSAAMISRVFLTPSPAAFLSWRQNYKGQVRDGRFEIHGLDPGADIPIYFVDPKGNLGATAMLAGKSGSGGPVTVRLEPCGTAGARLVDATGKPVAGYRWRTITMVVTPGAQASGPAQRDQLAGEVASLSGIDPTHYRDGPVSDAEGRIAFPALIPGATYSVTAGPRAGPASFRKDFTVKPGEILDLGNILVERPPARAQ
jgi:hypothetical protein